MTGKRKLVIKICPLCGEEKQVEAYEFKRTGNTKCRRCAVKTSTFNLRGGKKYSSPR